MTPLNTTLDGRCRKCNRVYHRAYYNTRRQKASTVSLLWDLVNALEKGVDVKPALRAGRKRLIELGHYCDDPILDLPVRAATVEEQEDSG